MDQDPNPEVALENWHAAVNSGDVEWAKEVVTDPVSVDGPHGAADITAAEFADWVARSRIHLEPHEVHQVSEAVVVVAQWATRPAAGGERTEVAEVATLFAVSGVRVSTAHRFDDVASALAAAEKNDLDH